MENRIFKLIIVLLSVSVFFCTKTVAQNDISQKDLGLEMDFYLYPTPSELLNVIDKESLTYNKNILNSAQNEQNYILIKSQYLNLGVYMSDLAYCAFFSKRSKSLEYIEVISNLSSCLLISSDLKNHLGQKISENFENMDSVYRITNEYYYDIMRELENNKSSNVIYIITTGAYIESFYISLNIINEFSDDNIVLQEIAKQKFALYNLRKFSKHFADDPNVSDIIKYQDEMIEIFDSFLEEEGTKRSFKIMENGRIQFTGGPIVTMNKEQYEKLKEIIDRIRNEIIN